MSNRNKTAEYAEYLRSLDRQRDAFKRYGTTGKPEVKPRQKSCMGPYDDEDDWCEMGGIDSDEGW